MRTSKQTLDIVINMTHEGRYTVQFQHNKLPIGEDQHYSCGRDVARCIRGVTRAFPNYALISKNKAVYDIIIPLVEY